MYHRFYYILLIFLAVSLPLSVFTTTIAEMLLVANWIWERDFQRKWQDLKKNKGAVLFSSIYLIHLLWLLNTQDFSWALHDLKIKLPLLVLPLIIASSSPLNEKELRNVLLFFTAAVFAGSIVSAGVFFGITGEQVLDYREISVFVSHIRMALMVVFSIFTLVWYLTGKGLRGKWKYIFIPVILWFILYLIMLRSVTGLILMVILALIQAFRYSGKITDVAPRFIARVMLITLPLLMFSWIFHSIDRFSIKDDIDLSQLDKTTPLGNMYFHDRASRATENGHFVYLYISEDELREEWSKASDLSYDGKDKKGQDLRFTLFRYMSSKGLRKDATGFRKLTEDDVRAVENGIANHIYLKKFSLKARLYEVMWEIESYREGHDAGGHSVTQRIVYLRAAGDIFMKNPIFGTGTGDIKEEFNTWHRESGAIGDERWWNRAHNQYMTFLVAFGITGFLPVLFFLLAPPFMERKWNDYLFFCFAVIGFLSMLNEDTLETQTGVSFFVFFYSLLLFGVEKPPRKI